MAMFKHSAMNRSGRLHLQRDDVLVVGVIILGFLLVGMIVADSLIFYQTIIVERPHGGTEQKSFMVTTDEIDTAIQILDAREEKFNEIVSGQTK